MYGDGVCMLEGMYAGSAQGVVIGEGVLLAWEGVIEIGVTFTGVGNIEIGIGLMSVGVIDIGLGFCLGLGSYIAGAGLG